MTTLCLSVSFCVLTQVGALNDSGSDGNPSRSAAQAGTAQTLSEQFAALELRFKAREKVFENELHTANKLEANARSQKITDENEHFNHDWHALAENVRALIRAHPADPAVFEGIIMRSSGRPSFGRYPECRSSRSLLRRTILDGHRLILLSFFSQTR